MKKTVLILFVVIFNLGVYSCSPESNTSDHDIQQTDKTDCCGDDNPITPPPPTED